MKAAVSLACGTVHATFHITVILIFTAVRNSDIITFCLTPCSGHNCQVKLVSSTFYCTIYFSLWHAAI